MPIATENRIVVRASRRSSGERHRCSSPAVSSTPNGTTCRGNPDLAVAEERQDDGGQHQGGRVQGGHPAPAGDGEQPGTGQRADQPQSLADGGQQTVRRSHQVHRQHGLHQTGDGRVEHDAAEPVPDGHGEQEPQLVAVLHEPERHTTAALIEVESDHHRPPGQSIDHHARERGEQARSDHGEHRQTGDGVAARQRLGPDAEDQQQRPLAEHRQGLTGQQQPEVTVSEELTHRVAHRARPAAASGR